MRQLRELEASMNKVIITGNLTKEPDLRTTGSGTTVCTLSVAVTRRFKGQNGEKQTDFFTVIAWKQLAEMCGKYLSKGKKVAVVGELQTRSYEKDGVKRYITEIIADEVEFLSPKETGAESHTEPTGFIDIQDSDLPF